MSGAIGAVRSAPLTSYLAACSPSSAPSASLLPAASAGTDGGADDAMSLLALSMSKLGNSEAAASEHSVHLSMERVKAKQKDKADERAKAEEAAKKGGFLDDLVNNSGVLGAIGLVTFCPELVAADLIIHGTGLNKHLDGEDNLMIAGALTGGGAVVVAAAGAMATRRAIGGALEQDYTGLTDEKVRPAMQYLWAADLAIVSLAVTGATFGSGAPLTLAIIAVALSGAAMAVEKTKCMDGVTGQGSSEYWALGLQIGGLGCSLGSSFLAPAGAAAAGVTATRVADALNGGSQVVTGADHMERAVHEKEAADHDIRAEQLGMEARHHQRIVDMVIDGIKEAHESHQRAMESLQGAIETKNQTPLGVAGMMKG